MFMSREEVVLTGKFLPNGTCHVEANGIPVFRSTDSAQTYLEPSGIVNVAPGSYSMRTVGCQAKIRSGSGSRPGWKLFFIMFPVRGPGPILRAHLIPRHNAILDTAIDSADVALFDERWNRQPGRGYHILGDGAGTVSLAGFAGEIERTSIGPSIVVGHFRVRARREWSF